ncbi:hypothetical protein TWF481_007740 [Arthrobotrys musiformis]|uniref:Uncharacterized protein n=1 Tax=Arthrobotrys musiformis TaxID=47236 RepID=A0AAV9WDD0_9PEZI
MYFADLSETKSRAATSLFVLVLLGILFQLDIATSLPPEFPALDVPKNHTGPESLQKQVTTGKNISLATEDHSTAQSQTRARPPATNFWYQRALAIECSLPRTLLASILDQPAQAHNYDGGDLARIIWDGLRDPNTPYSYKLERIGEYQANCRDCRCDDNNPGVHPRVWVPGQPIPSGDTPFCLTQSVANVCQFLLAKGLREGIDRARKELHRLHPAVLRDPRNKNWVPLSADARADLLQQMQRKGDWRTLDLLTRLERAGRPEPEPEPATGYDAGWKQGEPFPLFGPQDGPDLFAEPPLDPGPGDDFYWRQYPGGWGGPGPGSGSGGPGLIGKRDTLSDPPTQ